jgi:hypothetical protein
MGQFSFSGGQAMSTFEGYLLDVDDEYYYLGLNSDAIDVAFDRQTIYSVQIIQPRDVHRQMLDNLEVPEEEHEVN